MQKMNSVKLDFRRSLTQNVSNDTGIVKVGAHENNVLSKMSFVTMHWLKQVALVCGRPF